MPIPTTQSYARHTRRLNQLNRKVEGVLAAMRDGAVLHRLHQPNSVEWKLSTGQTVTTEVARLITESADIVGVGGCLFIKPGVSSTAKQRRSPWRTNK
jgi:hypothetical protein